MSASRECPCNPLPCAICAAPRPTVCVPDSLLPPVSALSTCSFPAILRALHRERHPSCRRPGELAERLASRWWLASPGASFHWEVAKENRFNVPLPCALRSTRAEPRRPFYRWRPLALTSGEPLNRSSCPAGCPARRGHGTEILQADRSGA